MMLPLFGRVFAAALAITSALASPYGLDSRNFFELDARNALSPRDTVIDSQCSHLVIGATRSPDVGTVCVALTGGTLTITYTITVAGYTLGNVHAWVGTHPPDSTDPGNKAFGSYPYTTENGKCVNNAANTTAVCTVTPIPDAWRGCSGVLYVVTHADVKGPQGGTAFDNGDCFGTTQGNCPKFFNVTKQCRCPIVYTFAPISVTTVVPYLTSTTVQYLTSTTSEYTTSTTVQYLTSTTSNYVTSTTSEYETSTTLVYTTSTTVVYTTSTTVEYTTSTTSEYVTSTTVTYPTSTTSEYTTSTTKSCTTTVSPSSTSGTCTVSTAGPPITIGTTTSVNLVCH